MTFSTPNMKAKIVVDDENVVLIQSTVKLMKEKMKNCISMKYSYPRERRNSFPPKNENF